MCMYVQLLSFAESKYYPQMKNLAVNWFNIFLTLICMGIYIWIMRK
jgi:hypothetical protein